MEEFSYLPDVLVLLSAAVFVVVIFNKLKLSPVLGYLIMGTLVGKYGFNIITDTDYADSLSKFGVVFLLFVIGLEFTFARLNKMRLYVFGFGALQIILTTALLAPPIYRFVGLSLPISILIAAALSLSSTAIVLQVLNEYGRQATQVGRISLGTLLMQDFTVVPLLTVVPILAVKGTDILAPIGISILKAVITIFAIIISSRILLKPFFSIIGSVKRDDIYVTTSLFLVLGAAWITENLGLSAAMGAFLAGLLIAETEYRNRIEHSIMPFQELFLALFFLSVGMSINLQHILQNIYIIISLSLALMAIKGVIILLICLLFRTPLATSIHTSLLLSQVGEFAFVLFTVAFEAGIIDTKLSSLLLTIVAFSMAITPLLAILGAKIEDHFFAKAFAEKTTQDFKGVGDLKSHVIIVGFGRVGRIVAYMLIEEKVDYVALDANLALTKRARRDGFPVYHGDLSDYETLSAIGAAKASAMALTMSDKLSVRKATRYISEKFPKLQLLVRVEDYRHAKGIKRLGADLVVPTTIETGLQVGGSLLRSLGIPDHEILSLKERVRKDEYELLEKLQLFKGVVEGARI